MPKQDASFTDTAGGMEKRLDPRHFQGLGHVR